MPMAVASLRPQDSNNRDDSARMIFCLNGLPSRDEGCYRDQVTMFMLILSLRRQITT